MRLVVPVLALCALAAGETPPPLRLPAGVHPTHQALDLRIVPSEPTFSGAVTIDLALDAPASLVWLHASDLAIDGAEFKVGGAPRPARVVPGDRDFVGFAVPAPLPRGAAQLVVRFHGRMDAERSRGLYRVAEGTGSDDWYAYTFFQPVDARRAFPCFDEPAHKVPWTLTLHVKKSHAALANAPAVTETDEAGGMKRVVFARSKPMPSYLVAFVVGPFELVDGGRAGRIDTPIRFVVPRGRAAETRYAREVTPRIVVELEKLFDLPFPFEKLDVAVVPRFWGTMEHPGLVALGQPLTLIKPAEEGLFRKQGYANTAIHELAHYWFGDYVTCRWWNDVWLNEALATWADGKVTDALEPAWKFTLGRDVGWASGAMGTDAQPTAQRIRLPVETRDAIASSFDNDITYAKGMAVLKMVEHWVGEARFVGALRKYLGAHAWGNADADAFLATLGAELGAPATEVMRAFIEQPGVPIVSAAPRCEGGRARVTLSQRRFFAAGDRPSPQAWRVPVCLKWDGGHRCALLDAPTQEVELPSCPRWLLANQDAAGYYRTRFDAASLAALRGAFATALSPRERASVAADVAAEAEQGTLSLGGALDFLPALLGDADLRVYRFGVNLLWLLNPRELDDAQLAAFGRAVEKLVGVRARSVGWAARPGEDPEMANVRPQLLSMMARFAKDRALIEKARELAARWLTDRAAIAPDMVSSVLGLAALGEDAGLFDRLLAEARKVGDRRERGVLLAALGAFHTPALHQRALALVIGKVFDQRDSLAIVYRSLFARETREATWTFLEQHLDQMVVRMRDDEALWLFGAIPGAFCDADHRRRAEAFLAPRAKLRAGAAHALDDALEGARACEASLARNRTAIHAFLARY